MRAASRHRDLLAGNGRTANPTGSNAGGESGHDGKNLDRINLDGADLTGTSFAGSSVVGASFIGARLRGANLSALDAREADFANADLTDAGLSEAGLSGAIFGDARLVRSDLTAATYDRHTRCDGSDVQDALLVPRDVIVPQLTKARSLAGVDLSEYESEGGLLGSYHLGQCRKLGALGLDGWPRPNCKLFAAGCDDLDPRCPLCDGKGWLCGRSRGRCREPPAAMLQVRR